MEHLINLELKHLHHGMLFDEGLQAAIRMTLETKSDIPASAVRTQTNTLILIDKTKKLDSVLAKMLGIPAQVDLVEKWVMELDCDPRRVMMTCTVDMVKYSLHVCILYQEVRTMDGKSDVLVHGKIIIRGARKDSILLGFVRTFVEGEFATARRREAHLVSKQRRGKLEAVATFADSSSDQSSLSKK